MRFQLMPTSLRKHVNIQGECVRQTISFDARLVTSDCDHEYDPSTFKDGRAISSLNCKTWITAQKGEEAYGFVSFVPAFSDSELQINEPDSLDLKISVPPDAFDKLWATVSDGKSIVLGGEVKGLPSKRPYSRSLSPFTWDVDGEDNRHKQVEEFWFTDLVTAHQQTSGYRAALRLPDNSLSASADKLRASIQEKYPVRSQTRRICLKALDQADSEAARCGLTGSETSQFLDDTIELVARLQISLREYDWKPEVEDRGVLWHHPYLQKAFLEGRKALGSWLIHPDDLNGVCHDLLARPWLRLDEMEWIIVSALVFNKIFEFGENLKESSWSLSQVWAYASTRRDLQKIGWADLEAALLSLTARWGLVAAGLCWAWSIVVRNHHDDTTTLVELGGALLILKGLLVDFPVVRRATEEARNEHGQLLRAMRNAYGTMTPGAPLSPYQIRAALLSAQEKGAVWPTGTFALLDRAAMRDPPVWVV